MMGTEPIDQLALWRRCSADKIARDSTVRPRVWAWYDFGVNIVWDCVHEHHVPSVYVIVAAPNAERR